MFNSFKCLKKHGTVVSFGQSSGMYKNLQMSDLMTGSLHLTRPTLLPKIAVVGATGNVGREVLDIIDEKEIQYSDLIALASSRSKGSTIDYGENKSVVVGDLAEYDFSDTDLI